MQQEIVGHEMLVDILLREMLVCSGFLVPKPYLAALCKVAAALEVFPVGEAEGGVSGDRRQAGRQGGSSSAHQQACKQAEMSVAFRRALARCNG